MMNSTTMACACVALMACAPARIEGRFGRLTIGRQYTMKAYATSPVNMFGTGAQGITTLDNGVANPRADNAVSYRVNVTRALEVGVDVSTGRDGVATAPLRAAASNCPGETSVSKQCREASGLIRYTAGVWGIGSAYEPGMCCRSGLSCM